MRFAEGNLAMLSPLQYAALVTFLAFGATVMLTGV